MGLLPVNKKFCDPYGLYLNPENINQKKKKVRNVTGTREDQDKLMFLSKKSTLGLFHAFVKFIFSGVLSEIRALRLHTCIHLLLLHASIASYTGASEQI